MLDSIARRVERLNEWTALIARRSQHAPMSLPLVWHHRTRPDARLAVQRGRRVRGLATRPGRRFPDETAPQQETRTGLARARAVVTPRSNCYRTTIMICLRSAGCLVAALSMVGCQNNTIELETDPAADSTETASFVATMDTGPTERPNPTDTESPNPTTGPPPSTTTGTPQPTGTMLLAVDSVIAPGLPFQGIVSITPVGTSVDLTLQWLSLNQGSTTTPRIPVGDIYAYPGIPVDPDGGFLWETGVILLPGAANPATGGDVVLTMAVAASPAGNPYCGRVSGSVIDPIQVDLEGSTHAMTTADPTALPVDFPVTCP